MFSLELLASCLIYCASIGYGGAISALGAGLPELAANLKIPESVCGQLFAFRGAGYLFGSLFASKFGKQKFIPTYGVVALAIYLSGFSTALSALTTSFTLLKVALFFQGIGFSLIDVFGAVSLCELWGDRVQPWIQIRSATCSSGAIVGPLLIAHLGFRKASLLVAGICFCTVGLHVAVTLKVSYGKHRDHLPLDSETGSLVHDHHGMELAKPADTQPVMPQSLYRYSLLNSTGLITADPSIALNSTPTLISHPCSPDRVILILLAAIMLVFHGVYYVASGWIPTYALLSGITDDRAKAASLLSAYSTALMTGSTFSAFISFYIPKQWILRIILAVLGISSLLLVLMSDSATFNPLLICVIVMGLSIGPMYGLILTLPTQLNMVMDSDKTSAIVFGGCIGESFLPVFVGWCIGQWGPTSFPWSMLLMLLAMLALYTGAYFMSMMTSNLALKKPWRALKLKIRSVSISSLATQSTTSPEYSAAADELSSSSETENRQQDETIGLMDIESFEISIA